MAATSLTASQIAFAPAGGVAAQNVQGAVVEVAGDVVAEAAAREAAISAEVTARTNAITAAITGAAGQPNGLATLDSGGDVPASQLGNIPAVDLSGLAPLASPSFTGNPTVPTQAPGNNSTRASSTAFTTAAVAAEALVRQAADDGLDGRLDTVESSSGVAALVDAKGDLLAATGPDALERVAAGLSGSRLTADPLMSSGVRWHDDATTDFALNIKDPKWGPGGIYKHGALGNNARNPLSGFFPDLAAAQAVYPSAQALTDTLDTVVLEKIIASLDGGSAPWPTGTSGPRGRTILAPFGKYLLCRTTHITRQITLIGEGGEQPGFPQYSGTQFVYDNGVSGIIFHSAATAAAFGQAGNATGACVKNIAIRAAAKTIAGAHGVQWFTMAKLANAYVEKFSGDGLRVVAGHGDTPTANANHAVIEYVTTTQNGGHGILVRGIDANTLSIIALNATSNGKWNIRDSSFLGNAYFGSHTAGGGADISTTLAADISASATTIPVTSLTGFTTDAEPAVSVLQYGGVVVIDGEWIRYTNYDATASPFPLLTGCRRAVNPSGTAAAAHVAGATVEQWFGGYITDGDNNNSVFVNSYAEGGVAVIDNPAIVLGGTLGNLGSGLFINGKGYITPYLKVPLGVSKTAGDGETGLGVFADLYEAQNFNRVGHGHYRLRHEIAATLEGWSLKVDNSVTAYALTSETDPRGKGRFVLPGGVWIGRHTSASSTSRLIYGTAAPTTGTWARGDTVLNALPASGQPSGWVCTLAGTPGTWDTMGTVGFVPPAPSGVIGSTRQFIPAPSLGITSLGGTAAATLTGNISGSCSVWSMPDNDLNAVGLAFEAPDDWLTFKVAVRWSNRAATTGDVTWRCDHGDGIDGTVMARISGSNVTAAAGASGVPITTELATGLLIPAGAGDLNAITVFRRGTDAADTLTNAVSLLGLILEKVS